MKDLRNEYLKNDEEKLMSAIHTNNKKARMEYRINRELERISKKENERKEQRTKRLITIAIIAATILVVVLGIKYNEKQINNCMEAGNNETFCRFAGE